MEVAVGRAGVGVGAAADATCVGIGGATGRAWAAADGVEAETGEGGSCWGRTYAHPENAVPNKRAAISQRKKANFLLFMSSCFAKPGPIGLGRRKITVL